MGNGPPHTGGRGPDPPTNFGRLWNERWGDVSSNGGLRRSATEFVIPQQQIRRDRLEAQRVAAMFDHLKHMDDALWGPGQRRLAPKSQPAAQSRPVLGAFVPLLTALFVFTIISHFDEDHILVTLWPLNDFSTTLLVHAVALVVSYVVFEPLFRWLSLTAMRQARKQGSYVLAKAVYLNSILLREERAASSILCAYGVNFSFWSSARRTRRILFWPCIALLLLLLTGGLRKLLEFAFLNSKLRTRFETDVLTNAFEQAAWLRLAELPDGSLADDSEISEEAPPPVMPDIDAPHVFESRTADMLRTAFCSKRDDLTWESLSRARSVRMTRRHSMNSAPVRMPEGDRVSPETLQDLLGSSSTIFLTQAEGRYGKIHATAKSLFQQLTRSRRGLRGRLGGQQMHARVLRAGLLSAMTAEDAERTWQLITSACDGDEGVNQRMSASEQDFVAAFRATFERFHIIAATVKDYAGIWFIFSDVLAVVHMLCSVGIVLAIFFSAEVIRTVFISISTAILGLSFVFGGLLKEAFESIVHILVMNPYDVGDRIQLEQGRGSKIYTVQKINILTTEVRDLYNQTIYFKNSTLFKGRQIVNLGRSLNAVVEIGFEISASQMSNALAGQLRAFMRKHIAQDTAAWVPSYLRSFSPIEGGIAGCDLSGSVTHRFRLMHRKPWQHIGSIRQDVTRLLLAMLDEMRRLDLDFRLPTQPVQLEGLRGPLQASLQAAPRVSFAPYQAEEDAEPEADLEAAYSPACSPACSPPAREGPGRESPSELPRLGRQESYASHFSDFTDFTETDSLSSAPFGPFIRGHSPV